MATPRKDPKPRKSTKAKKITAPKPVAGEAELDAAPETIADAVVEAEHEAVAAEEKLDVEDGAALKPSKKPAKKARVAAPKKKAVAPEKVVAAESAADDVADDESTEVNDESDSDSDSEFTPQPRPPAKLERLQKILAAAGVASRRSAETMIEQGRVQVNGKIVTVLGTKADAGRDHIRVDGKLLQGAERHRYFVLNKPRGFVTTVKDPEGRPTVMQFFDKMKERLYPVGRLDYMSEGLLVVTNDGELANRLTKASSGVEKTYLVKVAGQPTEAELDILRGGVRIALGAPGSRSIRTSPARIRQVRQGDNPWYEVVLIEGRNRELRKMFEEVGHFVEKIRRTGYGPLVLDQEPGNLRELDIKEVDALRLAAEGKLRTPKAKELRRRNLLDAGLLPTVLPKPSDRPRPATPPAALERPAAFTRKKFGAAAPASRPAWKKDDRPTGANRPARTSDSFARGDANKFFRSPRPNGESFRPAAGRTSAPNPVRSFSGAEEEHPRRSDNREETNFGFNRPSGRSFDRSDARPAMRNFERPAWKKGSRPTRPPARFAAGQAESGRPGADRPFTPKPTWKKPERADRSTRPSRPEFQRPATDRSGPDRSAPARFGRSAKPGFNRSAPPRNQAPRREARVFDEDLGPVRPPNLHIEEIIGPSYSGSLHPSAPRANYGRPPAGRPGSNRPRFDRPSAERPRPARPRFDGPASSTRPGAEKPFRGKSKPTADRSSSDGWKPGAPAGRPSSVGWKDGPPRPFTTSSGKPRPGGARPSSKPVFGSRSKPGGPRPGGFSKSGYKGKPSGGSGPKRTGPRPSGKPGGKMRG
jgi:23S rRNA pseudouridine2605 synthase